MSFADHSMDITSKLQEHDRATPRGNMRATSHSTDEHWSEVTHYAREYAKDYALWCLNHQGILHAKTIKLIKEERAKTDSQATREAIFARVDRTIERARICGKRRRGEPPRPSC